MAHILTDAEALAALRINDKTECPNYDLLMSSVDDALLVETGHDWAADATVDPTAKLAASILLVALSDGADPPKAYQYKITQLDAKAKATAEETV